MIDLQLLSNFVWELRFYSMAAQAAHWRVFGPSSYSDHLLYGVVYEKLDELLDPIAERLTAMSQLDDMKFVSPVAQAEYVATRMRDVAPRLEESLLDPSLTAAFFYEELFSLSNKMRAFASDLAHCGQISLGLEDLLAAAAGELETLVFFLERRAQILKPGV